MRGMRHSSRAVHKPFLFVFATLSVLLPLAGQRCQAQEPTPVTGFDDITHWIGAGANRAALAIDWSDADSDDPALVWGYRWEGLTSGADMLTAIVAADTRLFAKLGGTPEQPLLVAGLGYDDNGDGEFGLDDGTDFGSVGLSYAGASDGGNSLAADDQYAEGWLTGFWHYGVANANPYADGSWISSPLGLSQRPLVDGAWDSWTFSPTFSFLAFATNPQAAASPSFPGDFDADGRIDGRDFLIWQSHAGMPDGATLADGDADGDGDVDGDDFVVWHTAISEAAGETAALNVPEPVGMVLFCCGLVLVSPFPLFRQSSWKRKS